MYCIMATCLCTARQYHTHPARRYHFFYFFTIRCGLPCGHTLNHINYHSTGASTGTGRMASVSFPTFPTCYVDAHNFNLLAMAYCMSGSDFENSGSLDHKPRC